MIDAAAFVAAHNEAQGIVTPAAGAQVTKAAPAARRAPVEYARAPAAPGVQPAGARPAAIQRSTR